VKRVLDQTGGTKGECRVMMSRTKVLRNKKGKKKNTEHPVSGPLWSEGGEEKEKRKLKRQRGLERGPHQTPEKA